MVASIDERAQRIRLVGQQLHQQEEIDGLFDVNLDRLVAVTSERIMIVSGGGTKGWAQTSIPWRVVTSVELNDTESADEVGAVQVDYTARLGRMSRNGEGAARPGSAVLCPDTVEDAQSMFRLMSLRRPAESLILASDVPPSPALPVGEG